jgi:hypothetical protein
MKGDFEIMFSREIDKSFFADVLGTAVSNDSVINEIISDAVKDNVYVESIRLNTNTLDPYVNCLITVRAVPNEESTHYFPIHLLFMGDCEEAMNEIRKELCDFIEKEIEKRDELFISKTPFKMA